MLRYNLDYAIGDVSDLGNAVAAASGSQYDVDVLKAKYDLANPPMEMMSRLVQEVGGDPESAIFRPMVTCQLNLFRTSCEPITHLQSWSLDTCEAIGRCRGLSVTAR